MDLAVGGVEIMVAFQCHNIEVERLCCGARTPLQSVSSGSHVKTDKKMNVSSCLENRFNLIPHNL